MNFDTIAKFRGLGGVRIEDNVCVLPPGGDQALFNLTVAAGVPKTIQDVQDYIAATRK